MEERLKHVTCIQCENWAPKPNDTLARGGFAPCLASTQKTAFAATYPRECRSFKPAPAEKVQRRRELFGIEPEKMTP